MICLKKIIIHHHLMFFGVVFSVFFSLFSFGSSLNVSAIADKTFTFDSTFNYSTTSPRTLCSVGGSGGRSNCLSYKYIYITKTGTCDSSVYLSFFYYNSPNRISFVSYNVLFSDFSLVSIDYSISPFTHFYSIQAGLNDTLVLIPSGCTVTATFTENLPLSGSTPSGSITLTENGTFDVSSYAEAVVDVPAEVIYGDYHDDLISINNSIIMCAGVCLVLYFFYCIYRMIIKNTGGGR